MSLLNHQELKIVMGLGPLPGDAYSAESAPVVVNLMDDVSGFALDEWIPQIPALKGGGLWAESSLGDGRRLIGGGEGNVTEKIVLSVSASTYEALYTRLRLLAQMRQAALDFHRTDWQIQPVYLKWWARCAPGPQYALIYSLEYAAPEIQDSPLPQARLALTLERECYWRAIPPGANPKLWTFEAGGFQPFTIADLKLWSGSNHLFFDTVENKHEWDSTNYVTPLTQNFVTVPAASIPGDAPALALLDIKTEIDAGVGSYQAIKLFIARRTAPRVYGDHNAGQLAFTSMLNAGDGSLVGGVKTLRADGVVSNGSNVNQYLATFAAGAGTITWSRTDGLKPFLDQTVFRGHFAFFARARQNAGVAGDLKLQLTLSEVSSNILINSLTLPLVNVPVMAGPSILWPLAYLGEAQFPLSSNVSVGIEGYGLEVSDAVLPKKPNYQITLTATAPVARQLEVLDLILLPVDEAALQLIGTILTTTSSSWRHFIMDSTGYLTHGRPDPFYAEANESMAGGLTGNLASLEAQGSELTLQPGVDNYLHTFWLRYNTPLVASIGARAEFRLNLVPRWVGVRDV